MTGFDEIAIQQAEIRHQYNLMMDLKAKMNKEKELLELQIRENYVHLINRKKSLYPQWIFGLVDFDKLSSTDLVGDTLSISQMQNTVRLSDGIFQMSDTNGIDL